MLYLSLLKPLIEPGIMLGKTELVKRFRKFYNNELMLQMLFALPFSLIGRNEKGELYYC